MVIVVGFECHSVCVIADWVIPDAFPLPWIIMDDCVYMVEEGVVDHYCNPLLYRAQDRLWLILNALSALWAAFIMRSLRFCGYSGSQWQYVLVSLWLV